MAGSGSNPNQAKDRPSISLSPSDEAASDEVSDDIPDILVIEDSTTDVFLIREALGGAGVNANIHIVRDGAAATSFFDAADADAAAPCPTLILLDLNLPRKNGAEVLRHLRESARCRAAKVIIVSSSDSPRDRISVEGLGAARYFRKPSDYAGFMKLGPLVREVMQSQGRHED